MVICIFISTETERVKLKLIFSVKFIIGRRTEAVSLTDGWMVDVWAAH